jgi:hypothetical protein
MPRRKKAKGTFPPNSNRDGRRVVKRAGVKPAKSKTDREVENLTMRATRFAENGEDYLKRYRDPEARARVKASIREKRQQQTHARQ